MAHEILIVGMGEIGASIGLAIAGGKHDVICVGHDPEGSVAREARKAGAVSKLAMGLERAAEHADLVILALAPGQVEAHLRAIGPRLKQGAIVVDTSSLKAAAMGWAAEVMPEGCHYIGAVPIVGWGALHLGGPGPAEPRADLFQGSLMAMVVSPRTPETAVDQALTLAHWLGMEPFFIDPAEVDAVVATVEDLPALLGAALILVAVRSPGWNEARRMAGRTFARTAAAGTMQLPKDFRAGLLLNRTNVLTRLDAVIEELRGLEGLIADGAEEELEGRLAEAQRAHGAWLGARARGDWQQEELGPVDMPQGGMMDRLLGLGGGIRAKDRRRGEGPR
jgi:prephenate dehydrogenase